MLRNRQRVLPRRNQRGAILIVCLVFLTVLTLLAVSGMDSSVTEERMAGNMQDYNQAFEAAEVAIEQGELWLGAQIDLPTSSAAGTADVWSADGPDADADGIGWWLERDAAWWTANGEAVAGVGEVSAQPTYVIEEIFTSTDGQSLAIGTGELSQTRVLHRVTARGTGGSGNSEVMLQSTYIRTYD
ncbi:MAG TPA: PilX N-terminal domain-containing pilus assembly protein [Pseudomonadales bacterium]